MSSPAMSRSIAARSTSWPWIGEDGLSSKCEPSPATETRSMPSTLTSGDESVTLGRAGRRRPGRLRRGRDRSRCRRRSTGCRAGFDTASGHVPSLPAPHDLADPRDQGRRAGQALQEDQGARRPRFRDPIGRDHRVPRPQRGRQDDALPLAPRSDQAQRREHRGPRASGDPTGLVRRSPRRWAPSSRSRV